MARYLVRKKTYTLGLIIPFTIPSFFPGIAQGVEDFTNKKGYSIILCHSKENYEKEKNEIEIPIRRGVDGFIITPSQDTEDIRSYLELIRRKSPCDFIERYFKEIETSDVIHNDKKGVYQSTTHLIRLGYQRIDHIGGPSLASTTRNRMAGYQQAFKENHIALDKNMIKEGSFEEGYKAMQEFVKDTRGRTAVFAVNDLVATGVIRPVKEAGLKVPKDIAIVGFGNIHLAEVIRVHYSIPAEIRIRRESCEITNREKREHLCQAVIEPELVIGYPCRQKEEGG